MFVLQLAGQIVAVVVINAHFDHAFYSSTKLFVFRQSFFFWEETKRGCQLKGTVRFFIFIAIFSAIKT